MYEFNTDFIRAESAYRRERRAGERGTTPSGVGRWLRGRPRPTRTRNG